MIERAVGCLEKGGTRLSRVKLWKPRHLHSAFWSHGAGSIDLPSWWLTLLQLPQAKETPEAARGNAGPRLLDFLYPSQALAFVQKFRNPDPAIFRRQRRTPTAEQRPRAYASLTTDAPSGIANYTAQYYPEMSLRQQEVEGTSGDRSHVESLEARLDYLLQFDDREANQSELWQIFLKLQKLSFSLQPRQTLRLLRCLARSKLTTNQERLLNVFDSLPIKDRKSIHYSYAISAALNRNNLAVAVRLYTGALSAIHVPIGTSSLLSYTVERGFWQVAIETWQAYWNYKEGNNESPDIWTGVDSIPLPELWVSTVSAIDFAARMTELADSGAAAASREFALGLTTRSFARRSFPDESVHKITTTYGLKRGRVYANFSRRLHTRLLKPGVVDIQYPNIDLHWQLFDKATKLQAPTQKLYEVAIFQALSFKSRLYTIHALKFYQSLRQSSHIIPTKLLLKNLLGQVSAIHSEAGIFLLLNDYRYYHGHLSRKLFRIAIPELADQGNRKAVEGLLAEACSQYGEIKDSRIANAILHVCIRRGEVQQAVKTFNELEKRYGFKPDLRSFNAVIETHARVGDIEGASRWYNNLLDFGFRPIQQTLVPLMALFAKRGDLEAVKQLLRQSEIYGIETNIAMIDTLVLAQINNNELTAAEALVNEALETVEKVPKRSRTRMWNYLLNAFAMRGDLDKVTDLHRKMRVNNIPSDGTTFAALMHGLSIKEQSAAAYRILTEIMPQLAIVPTALHYAICMSGSLSTKNYRRLFALYAEMLGKDVKPDMAVHNLLIRAAAGIDTEAHLENAEGLEQQKYELARQTFEQALRDMDPMELATYDPIKFVGFNRLDESFSSSYFSYLIFLHGKQKAMDRVNALYDIFGETKRELQMDVESSPPFQMLSALMVTHLNAKDYDAVDQCWDTSLQKGRMLACRLGAKTSEAGWVLPARRYIMNVHLRHYMTSLIDRSKHHEIIEVIKHLQHCGYELDSKTWNYYVRILVENNQVALAFECCEKELMPGWEGWAPNNERFMKRALHFRQPKRLEPHRRLPAYETLVYLAAAFVDAQSSVSVKGGKPLSQQLYEVAPKTADVVHHLPRLDDALQRRLLNRS